MTCLFPFSAVVGQDLMKRALLAVLVNPRIGGLLLCGEKGTAKSSLVRSLRTLVPPVNVVPGCLWKCDPVDPSCPECRQRHTSDRILPSQPYIPQIVELPLSATEDRLTGGLDLEPALLHGHRRFQPGLLAQAHRGLLYIDEVNLLPDHLMAIILDASANGVNRVQREGLSLEHPARFSLVGSMNPEEGELRPQLLDRFGLCVQVTSEKDPAIRLRILSLKECYDADPPSFIQRYASDERQLGQKIISARKLMPKIRIPDGLKSRIAELSFEANCAGHRGELAIYHCAVALAALDGRQDVREADIGLAALLALSHRRREIAPPPRPDADRSSPPDQRKNDQPPTPPTQAAAHEQNQENGNYSDPQEATSGQQSDRERPETESEKVFEIGESFKVKPITPGKDRLARLENGRRARSRTERWAGRHITNRPTDTPDDLALEATIRAAAPHQHQRPRTNLAVNIRLEDYRRKERDNKVGSLIVFVVDASGSMGAARRMSEAKGAMLSLLMDAYQKRDQVAFIAFRGPQAQVLLEPTGSVERAYQCLRILPTGGKTPLASGLFTARRIIDREIRKNSRRRIILVLISDGRGNVGLGGDSAFDDALEEGRRLARNNNVFPIVIDVERQGLTRFGRAARLAESLGGACLTIETLKAEELVHSIKAQLGGVASDAFGA
jgi:magnesium chelatase subunit D